MNEKLCKDGKSNCWHKAQPPSTCLHDPLKCLVRENTAISVKWSGGKPIIFSTPMVQAILKGRKTMTRRAVKPPYKVGDILWVKETWLKVPWFHVAGGEEGIKYFYRADGKIEEQYSLCSEDKWKPSIFMPREAARIFLKVTDVRVERLWDITEEDAKAEGVEPFEPMNLQRIPNQLFIGRDIPIRSYKAGFYKLWEEFYGWDTKPLGVCYQF